MIFVIATDQDGDPCAINPKRIIAVELSCEDDAETYIVTDCEYEWHLKESMESIIKQIGAC